MIRTLDCKRFQLRFDWRGFGLFFGIYGHRAVKVYWWPPRLVFDLTDRNPVIVGWRTR